MEVDMKKFLNTAAFAATTIAFLCAISLNAQQWTKPQNEKMETEEVVSQTDWSGGPGTSGPVFSWDNIFNTESGINWYSLPGVLNLDFSSPIEHQIAGSYTRVNNAIPVDLDGDGDKDLLGAAGRYAPPYFFSGRIDWWENTDGSGTSWTIHTVDDNVDSAPSICSADLDEDGDADVIAAVRGTLTDIAWWENVDGLGITWTKHIIPSSIQEGSSIDTADVNGDGHVDLLSTDASYNKVAWLENMDGSGHNWTEHLIDYMNTPYDVYGADVDGDEDIDAVGAAFNGDDVSWWENVDGSGIDWDEHVVSNNFNGARAVYAADVDGDDDMDILGAASLDWKVSWWENNDGSGNSWIEHVVSSNFNYADAVYASDVDEDGDNDILGAAHHGNYIIWWENTDGSGLNLHEHIVGSNFEGATDVTTADMDGDGDPDIIGAAYESADITWWDVTTYSGEGELVSSILNTDAAPIWNSLGWTSFEPEETSIYFQVRSSMDSQNMGSWSIDITSPGSLQNYLIDGDKFVQYKVLLETSDPGLSPILEDVTISWIGSMGIDDSNNVSKPFALQIVQNFPNPFDLITTINFSIPETDMVILSVYDKSGKLIEKIFSEKLASGTHKCEWNAEGLPKGIYYGVLKTNKGIQAKKMIKL